MPTYVYRCDECNNQFELFQRMSDDPIDSCPNCQSKVRRVIHPVGVVFKGSGWYINDSRSNGKAAKDDSNGSDSSSSETKTEAKSSSDSKSESKTEPAKPAAD